MQKSNYVKLKSVEVRELMASQGLKHWWVAEEAGIHKTTLRRWLSGRIAKVKRDHVDRLAVVLTVEAHGIAEPLQGG